MSPSEKIARAYKEAGWLSRGTWSWVGSVVKEGYQRQLSEDDLLPLEEHDTAEYEMKKFQELWAVECKTHKGDKPSLQRVMWLQFRGRYFACVLLNCLQHVISLASPLMLIQILRFLDSNDPIWKGIVLAIIFGCIPFGSSMANQYSMQTAFMLGMSVRTLCSALVYDKTFNLSNSAWQQRSIGEIQNLMAFDAKAMGENMGMTPQLFSGPALILAILVLLGLLLGPSMLLGVAIMLLSFPVSGFAFGNIIKHRVLQSKLMDKRLKKLSEMLQGVRVLKFYAWESFFAAQIQKLRLEELRELRIQSMLRAVTTFSIVGIPLCVTMATFGLYTALGNDLTPEVAFPALLLFNALMFPLTFLPVVVTNVISVGVALGRIASFLQDPERDPTPQSERTFSNSAAVLRIKGGEFAWTESPGMPGFRAPTPPEEPKGKAAKKATSQAKAKKEQGEKKEAPKAATTGPQAVETATKEHEDVDAASAKASEADAQVLEKFRLSGLDVEVKKGSLVVVCGVVGSGKTSLLEAILGGMVKTDGEIRVHGSCAYASQVPWIMNCTLRENILFGTDCNEERYQKAVQAASLKKDLEMLPGGDDTEIGERGINLSGGQKARVSLARACYSTSDIILLDDPLAAVDAHVGKELTENCIKGFLLGRTRILVTNALHILPDADLILVMKAGKVVEQGTYAKLSAGNGELCSLMEAYGQTQGEEEDGALVSAAAPELPSQGGSVRASLDTREGRPSGEGVAPASARSSMDKKGVPKDELYSDVANKTIKGLDNASKDLGKLTTLEGREEGSVKLKHYLLYGKVAGGVSFGIILFGSYALGQVAKDLSSVTLSEWTTNTAKDDKDVSDSTYLQLYALLTVIAICAAIGRSIYLAYATTRASATAHSLILKSVFRAPTAFFDTTPTGRILNRFSKDTDTIDTQLPPALEQGLYIVFTATGTLILIGIVLPFFFLPLVPIMAIFFTIQQYFRPSSREIQRIESIAKSPIYNHFQETLNGVSTIRAYGVKDSFCADNRNKLNTYNRSWWMIHSALNRWLGVRLEAVGCMVILATALLAVTIGSQLGGAGYVGLVLVYAAQITPFLNYGVRQVTDVEAKMTSFERIMEYATLESEAAETTDADKELSTPWPSEGAIEFQNCSMRYRADLPMVLNAVTFSVSGGSKIGICGRTGAGKSSIMVGLFRMVELASGKLVVDGINISTLGLQTLRKSIVIMPQDAVLFSETVRCNIDPTGIAKDDAEIWSMLKAAQLDAFISSLEGGLDAMVAENGDNFSVGQRQCLCMARALLRKPKVLVLDEATASVDAETDQAIQSCIRTELSKCTCLTIAHRLHTIMDSDKILVMEKGEVGEYDKPSVLASKEGGLLSGLIDETGAQSAGYLRRIAAGEEKVLMVPEVGVNL